MAQHPQRRQFGLEPLQDGRSLVGAAVIDEDHLVIERAHGRVNFACQRLDVLGLVTYRDNNRELEAHAPTLPSSASRARPKSFFISAAMSFCHCSSAAGCSVRGTWRGSPIAMTMRENGQGNTNLSHWNRGARLAA